MRPILLILTLVMLVTFAAPVAAFNPVEDDLSDFTLATRLSPQPAELKATLNISARHPDGRSLAENFLLDLVRPTGRVPRHATQFYRLSDADRSRLAAVRARIEAWKTEAPETKGSLSFGLDTGETSGVRASLWIRPTPEDRYELIMRNAAIN